MSKQRAGYMVRCVLGATRTGCVARVVALTAASVAVLGLFAGESFATPAARSVPHKTRRLTTLTVAYTVSQPNLFDIALFYAKDHGLFRKDGLNVQVQMLNGDSLGLPAVLSGSADIGFFSNELLYQALNQGAKIQAFLENCPVQDYELIAPDSIAKPAQMTGKVLGTSGPGGIASVLPMLALQKAGVPPSAYTQVNVGGTSGRLSALLAGTISAGIGHIMDADLFFSENPGKFHVLLNLAKSLPHYQYAAFIAKRTTLASKRLALVQFARAILAAQRVVAKNESAAYNEFHRYVSNVPAPVVKTAWAELKSIGAFNLDGGMLKNNFSFTVQTLISQKLITNPVLYNEAYDTKIRNAAMTYFK